MKLGISSYTYTWSVGVPNYPCPENQFFAKDLLIKADEMNLNLLQICDNLPLHKISDKELQKIKNLAFDLKIDIEVGTRSIEQEHLLKYLEIANFFNSNILRIILEKKDGELEIEEGIKILTNVLPKFEKKDIIVAVENHEKYTTKELIKLMEAIDSPYFGICLDTVNSFGALEGPEQVVNRLAPYTVNLHIKDFIIQRLDHQMGFEITGAPAGYGCLNIEWLLEKINNNGKNPNAVLELWTPFTDNLSGTITKEKEWAKKSIEFLRGKINE